MPNNISVRMIKIVAEGLGELAEEVVFVGGATTGLYVKNIQIAPEIRQTDDVDCIIEIQSRHSYIELEEKLRQKGFVNDQKVICRWNYRGIVVDIMPTDESILGFSNRWYSAGIANAVSIKLEASVTVSILSLPYFIGCKLEALFSRGLGDLRFSKDFEDIVFLFNYANSISDEIQRADVLLKEYIQQKCKALLQMPILKEAIFCVLPLGENEPEYIDKILQSFHNLAID